MDIYFLQYECSPSPEKDDYQKIGGAFVKVWIKAISLENAKAIAEHFIAEDKWLIVKIINSTQVEKDLLDDDESLQEYENAEQDGVSFIYITWPNKPQAGESIH